MYENMHQSVSGKAFSHSESPERDLRLTLSVEFMMSVNRPPQLQDNQGDKIEAHHMLLSSFETRNLTSPQHG